MTVDRLSSLDAAFLHIERTGLPIHIGSVATFEAGPLLDADGYLRLDELRAQVSSRLDSLPRLRRKVAWMPLALGRPCWVDDPDFDVANHVDEVRLPASAGPDGLRRHAERLTEQPLPSNRPLWHLRFVTGLPDDRVGLIERVHHALVDGVSGVDVASTLLDLSPEVAPIRTTTWQPVEPSSTSLVADAVWSQVTGPARMLGGLASALAHPLRTARQATAATTALATVALDGVLAPRTSLNVPIGPHRRLAWISTDLDGVKQAGRVHRATVNDVVLCAIAEGLRALLLERGQIIGDNEIVKVLVPVSLRDEGHRGALGNEVGALLLRLPIGIADPIDRVQAIARTSERLKQRREATTTDLLLGAADLLPAPLVGPIAKLTETQRVVNVIVTNVPGPATPLYCRGARMLEAFPIVPLGGNFSVEVAILSYDGALNVSITAASDECPDLDVLAAGVEAGFDAVAKASGVEPVTRPAVRKAPVATAS
jgi:WS/DGAT/MGAT family acyltransferase